MGRNFVTPTILDYGQKAGVVYELAEGEIFHDKIFGVTVVDIGSKSNTPHPLSSSFSTLNEAYRYIDSNLGRGHG